jgi:hypothetical protein
MQKHRSVLEEERQRNPKQSSAEVLPCKANQSKLNQSKSKFSSSKSDAHPPQKKRIIRNKSGRNPKQKFNRKHFMERNTREKDWFTNEIGAVSSETQTTKRSDLSRRRKRPPPSEKTKIGKIAETRGDRGGQSEKAGTVELGTALTKTIPSPALTPESVAG